MAWERDGRHWGNKTGIKKVAAILIPEPGALFCLTAIRPVFAVGGVMVKPLSKLNKRLNLIIGFSVGAGVFWASSPQTGAFIANPGFEEGFSIPNWESEGVAEAASDGLAYPAPEGDWAASLGVGIGNPDFGTSSAAQLADFF